MANTVEYYLAKGLDLPTAKYYAAGRRRIVAVNTIDSRTVWSNKVDLCPDSCYLDSVKE